MKETQLGDEANTTALSNPKANLEQSLPASDIKEKTKSLSSRQEESEEPSQADYNLPANDEEMDDMIERMIACGMSAESAGNEIKKRKKQYEAAVKKFVVASKKTRSMPKRNSFNADM